MITTAADCTGETEMRLDCHYLLPSNGGFRGSTYTCKHPETCVDDPNVPMSQPDAGCLEIGSPSGVKGAGKVNGHACSSGLIVGGHAVFLMMSISADGHQFDNALKSCEVVRSGTSNSIYRSSPCSKTSTLIKLAAKTTYQACIDVTNSFLRTSVPFTWHLHGPGKIRGRGLDELGNERPLSEMLTVLEGGNSTANDAIRIVIGDGEL